MISLLRNRDFFWLWLGQSISQVGDGIRDWALIYWIFQASGHSPVVQALSFIAVSAPSLVMSPVAGVLVDRWDRRRVMIVADLARGILSLLMVAVAFSGQYGYALVLVFLGASVGRFFQPARSAMIPRVVGREHLMQANSLSQTTNRLLELAGPALGTSVYLALGPAYSFLADAGSFFLSAVCVALVGASGAVTAARGRRSFAAELKAGLRFSLNNRAIRSILIAATVLTMGAGAVNSLEIVLVRSVLHLPEAAMVYPSTAMPLAAMLGALAVGAAAGKLRRPHLFIPLGMALGAVGIGVTAGAPNLAWLIIGAVVVGLCNVLLNIGLATTTQTLVPDQMRGRVFATVDAVPTTAMLASAGLAGYLALAISPRLILGGGAVFIALGAAIAYAGLKDVTLERESPAARAGTAEV